MQGIALRSILIQLPNTVILDLIGATAMLIGVETIG
jgi:hypothetical protein